MLSACLSSDASTSLPRLQAGMNPRFCDAALYGVTTTSPASRADRAGRGNTGKCRPHLGALPDPRPGSRAWPISGGRMALRQAQDVRGADWEATCHGLQELSVLGRPV